MSGQSSAAPAAAITPRVSPDGKWLAFIRRIEPAEQLFVRDLAAAANGRVRASGQGPQEAWAVHASIRIRVDARRRGADRLGQGKIWRVDVDGANAHVIPFTAKVEQTITDAIRFPQEVLPAGFPVTHAASRRHVAGRFAASSIARWANLRPAAAGRRAGPPDGDAMDAFSVVLARRRIDRLRVVDRQGCGRIRVISPDGGAARDVVTTARALRRAVMVARRTPDRLSAPSARHLSRPR